MTFDKAKVITFLRAMAFHTGLYLVVLGATYFANHEFIGLDPILAVFIASVAKSVVDRALKMLDAHPAPAPL